MQQEVLEQPGRRPIRLAAWKIVTWNVNGLRAVLQRRGTSLLELLESLQADIVCLQVCLCYCCLSSSTVLYGTWGMRAPICWPDSHTLA
jgi:hypothetical protein